ncbi:MAG: hypothetical protein WEA04_01285 [Candidatus Andersenbacteria bacterium]
MVTPELQAYIARAQAAGKDIYQIRQALVEAGWPEADVREALATVNPTPGQSFATAPPPSKLWTIFRAMLWWLFVALEVLLLLRFVAKLLGITAEHIIGTILYTLTDPLTAPFVALLNPGSLVGSSLQSLVALARPLTDFWQGSVLGNFAPGPFDVAAFLALVIYTVIYGVLIKLLKLIATK